MTIRELLIQVFCSTNTMKYFSLFALSFAALLSTATATLGRSDASQLVINNINCYWDGTAPFCDGQCGSGTVECDTSNCGDTGLCCWTGSKKWCCYATTCPS
ncbi:hypothetical protein DEU56DRAFT_595172 [Suillus clintonianus]|uniref:uncharacterized protein n=1 Tax=Suillus clintonianus TaxID=1904413 RepID=UPI001B85BCD3|nr:uncharacterized protein DEU56DRAFT_595172 [Suillus clintonianus]KAG2124434.1 hypothetical protein DEU56DRAFT_595172 [Suillus clintonianus]